MRRREPEQTMSDEVLRIDRGSAGVVPGAAPALARGLEPDLVPDLVPDLAAGVARVTLNRPQVLNAFDETLIARLDAAFAQLDADPEVRVIVLAAHGRAFCAGADIEWMRRAAANDEPANLIDARRLADMLFRIDSCSKPVIARVQGAVYGGGVGLVCAADVVVAATSARFCLSEARLGIIPAVIGPYLVNAIGARQARRMALSCAVVGADEARAIGLAHDVVPLEQLDAAVERCAADLLKSGPAAMGEIKRFFSSLVPGPVTASIREHSARAISSIRASDEAREGFDAFLAKRPPSWTEKP
jgi:methylglutaconyl-CoA hydratase